MLTARAPAKVNLFLHVIGRRPDGYHLLESLIGFSNLHDTLHVAEASDITLKITGRFAAPLQGDPQPNIIVKAAHLLADRAGITKGAALTLDKELPIASGIGGGSSDAAAALRLLMQHWDISLPQKTMHEIALSLGADVPCCYHQKTAFISGIGEQVTELPSLPSLPTLMVNPLQSLSTPAVYKVGVKYFTPSQPLSTIFPSEVSDVIALLKATHNDLQTPAITLLPVISDILAIIRVQKGCQLSRMSGSGATCFGIFSTHEEVHQAAEIIRDLQPSWWVEPTILN